MLRGNTASGENSSCGRSNDVVVSRLNCPASGRSARMDVASARGFAHRAAQAHPRVLVVEAA